MGLVHAGFSEEISPEAKEGDFSLLPHTLPESPPQAPKATDPSTSKKPATLSLSMIVRDEEQVIERLLKQMAPVVDEMVIVDTGSTDKTVEICERYGARVYHFDWIDDFAAARNEALSHCTSDWIVWLDADDVLSADAIGHVLGTKNALLGDHLDVVYAPYHCQFDATGRCTVSVLRERLIRREAGYQWQHAIHEAIHIPEGARTSIHPSLIVEHRKPVNLVERSHVRNNRILEKALSEKKSCHLLLHYAQSFFPSEAKKAKALFLECVDYIPHDEAMHILGPLAQNKMFYDCAYYLMHCDLMLKDYNHAIEIGLQALAKECFRPQIYLLLGAAKYYQARYYDAVPFFNAALGCEVPQHIANVEEFQPWKAYDFLSLSYTGMGQHQKAIEMATRALDHQPVDSQRIVHNLRLFAERLNPPAPATTGLS